MWGHGFLTRNIQFSSIAYYVLKEIGVLNNPNFMYVYSLGSIFEGPLLNVIKQKLSKWQCWMLNIMDISGNSEKKKANLNIIILMKL